VYMRLLRGQVPLVLDKYEYRFELGKAKLLCDGNDVLFVSTRRLSRHHPYFALNLVSVAYPTRPYSIGASVRLRDFFFRFAAAVLHRGVEVVHAGGDRQRWCAPGRVDRRAP
jgi:hypothetical protein